MGTTTIHALPYSEGSEQLSTVDDRMQELAESLDPKLTPPLQGPLSRILAGGDLPAGTFGRHYFATDSGVAYLDTGATWIALNEHIGAVTWWAGTGDPPGGTHLQADGRPIPRLSYPLYASIIGTLHGGDAANVNLPDAKGRTLVGPDGAAIRIPNSPRTVGASGGVERHLLTGQESGVKNHNHQLVDENGNDLFIAHNAGGNGPAANIPTAGYNLGPIGIKGSGDQNAALAHQNMQPYLVLTPIVRVR